MLTNVDAERVGAELGDRVDVGRTKSEASDGEAEKREVMRCDARGVKRCVGRRQAWLSGKSS
jgi:hypothetical protein